MAEQASFSPWLIASFGEYFLNYLPNRYLSPYNQAKAGNASESNRKF